MVGRGHGGDLHPGGEVPEKGDDRHLSCAIQPDCRERTEDGCLCKINVDCNN